MNDTPVRYVHIYGLVDPRTDEVRYVGKSTSPQRRLIEHCVRAKLHPSNHRDYWIRSLQSLAIRPIAQILETVPEGEWQEAERRIIAALLQAGANLTNSTPGGEGMATGAQHPNTHLTPDDIGSLLRRVADGERVKDVATAFGIDRKNAYCIIHGSTWCMPEFEELRRRAESVCRRSDPKITPEDVVQIRDLYANGVAATTIAKRFGISRKNVYGVTTGRYWKKLPVIADTSKALMLRRSKGENHGRARLSDQEVREIRYLSLQGTKGIELARAFGVGRAQISRIINGKRRSTS